MKIIRTISSPNIEEATKKWIQRNIPMSMVSVKNENEGDYELSRILGLYEIEKETFPGPREDIEYLQYLVRDAIHFIYF